MYSPIIKSKDGRDLFFMSASFTRNKTNRAICVICSELKKRAVDDRLKKDFYSTGCFHRLVKLCVIGCESINASLNCVCVKLYLCPSGLDQNDTQNASRLRKN